MGSWGRGVVGSWRRDVVGSRGMWGRGVVGWWGLRREPPLEMCLMPKKTLNRDFPF